MQYVVWRGKKEKYELFSQEDGDAPATPILPHEQFRALEDFLICLRPDGAIEAPGTVSIMCRQAKKKVPGLADFHFHMLRHTFTSNLLSNEAAPKDVQELLGHADVSTTR